jgi:hypothetical protein
MSNEIAGKKPRNDRAVALIDQFLQHKKMEQTQDYLSRGRRFAGLDAARLSEDWVHAVRRWLARKGRSRERTMDDLAAELELRGSEPPYDAVKQELAARFAAIEQGEQSEVGRQFAQQIATFVRERHRTLQ